MPQLVPLYFTNESNSCFVLLILMTYVFSKHVLPFYNSLFSTRYLLCSFVK
uniref:ATP synthase protein 8 n=1 Tax=Bacidia sp. TaxID=2040699 RepID=A0A482K035_9LECA|nr:ATP synthase F0 subunit 8 [Bacidia sp.]